VPYSWNVLEKNNENANIFEDFPFLTRYSDAV